jgi:hypothetical protein
VSAAAYDPDELKRPQFENPALAAPALTSVERPYNEPALALAPEQRGGPAPTDALALQQPDPADEPTGVDAISGGSLTPPDAARPPPPGGQLDTDQLMTAASVPPPAGGDAVDQTIAAAQAANAPPAPPAKPPTIQEQEQAGLAEQDKLASDAEKAERAAGAARAKQAEASQIEAQQKAQIQAENAKREQAIVDQANARTQQWMDRSTAENDKFMRMGLHDYWDDKSVGNKILAGLAMVFGAAGGRSLADNPGYQMINTAIERDFRTQQANIAKQKENVNLAKQGVEDALNQKQQQLADNNLKKAAAYDAVAAQAVALKLKQGVPLEQASTDAAVVGLRQKANATRMETLKAVHGQNVEDAQLADQDERLKIEHERTGFEGQRVGIERDRLANDKLRAEAAMVSAQAHAKGKSGKGGGGGGGSSLDAAAVQLRKEIQDAADAGKPMTGDQILARGVQLKIPAEAKAGHVSIKSINTAIAQEGGIKAKNAKLDTGQVTEWARENKIPDLIKKQDELSAVLEEVNNAKHNPLQQALAIEKAVSSARGGAASRQALDLALHHLGGRWDSIEALIQGAKDGEVGEAQMKNFVGFMRNQLGTAQGEGKKKYDDFNKFIASQPAEKRSALEAQRGRVFSGVHGFGESAPSKGGGALPGGMKIVKVRDTQTGAIIEAIKRPDGSLVNKQTGAALQ